MQTQERTQGKPILFEFHLLALDFRHRSATMQLAIISGAPEAYAERDRLLSMWLPKREPSLNSLAETPRKYTGGSMSLDVLHEEMGARPPEDGGWELRMLPPCSPHHHPPMPFRFFKNAIPSSIFPSGLLATQATLFRAVLSSHSRLNSAPRVHFSPLMLSGRWESKDDHGNLTSGWPGG